MTQPQLLSLSELDERCAADKGLYDLVCAVSKAPVVPEPADWIDETPVWQQVAEGSKAPNGGTIRKLTVVADSSEAVREQLFRLGYHPDKFLGDDHEHYTDGYAPSGS